MARRRDVSRSMRRLHNERRGDWADRRLQKLREAKQLAIDSNMRLVERRYRVQYELVVFREGNGTVLWRYDLFPTTGRIRSRWIQYSKNRARRGPILGVDKKWTFIDVIQTALLARAIVPENR